MLLLESAGNVLLPRDLRRKAQQDVKEERQLHRRNVCVCVGVWVCVCERERERESWRTYIRLSYSLNLHQNKKL